MIIKVTGTIRRDDFGPTIFTDQVEEVDPGELNTLAKKVMDDMTGGGA